MSRRSCLFDDARLTAPDADAIRCTDDFVWLSGCCLRPWYSQMQTGDCRLQKLVDQTSFAMKWNVEMLLHSMSISLNALTKLFVVEDVAFDRDMIKCIDEIIRDCVENAAFDIDVIECIDDFICWWCRKNCVWY